MLEKRGAVLETARRVSDVFRRAGIDAPIIGGVAVVLHGHVRTTVDVDVYVASDLEEAAGALEDAGLKFDANKREFLAGKVPVHLIEPRLARPTPKRRSEIEEITTVSLADLINLKLKTGTTRVVRAQDLADVIGLIRANNLTAAFAPRIAKELRSEFKRLVKAVAES